VDWFAVNHVQPATQKKKKKIYAGNEKPLPTLIKEKEPLWYQLPQTPQRISKKSMGSRRVASLT
jgi:hypothetical protein